MKYHDAPVTPETLRRLHTVLWLACVVTYVAMLTSHVAAGGSDLWAMVKASASTLAVAILGRAILSLLARATRAPSSGSDHVAEASVSNAQVGSLLDIVSSPETDLAASPSAIANAGPITAASAVGAGNRGLGG
jgi:hypothetical protein